MDTPVHRLTCTCIIIIFLLSTYQLKFEEDLAITKMYSGEGEEIDFSEVLYPKGNVEDWLLEVERVMRESLKAIIGESLVNYLEVRKCIPILYSYTHMYMYMYM